MNTTNVETLVVGVNLNKAMINRWGWRALVLVALLIPVGVHAQLCVPPSLGVPPAYQPPHWWDNSPIQPIYYNKLTDPRWQGAAAVSKTDGTQETNAFLALQDGTYLYLSWRYRGMPLGTVGQNTLYVGYEPASGGPPVIVKAELATLSSTEAGGVGSVDADAIELDATGVLRTDLSPPGPNMADPTWVDDNTRVWINNPRGNSYAVQMRIPVSDIKFTAGTFKLWFEMLAGSLDAPVTRFVWPRTGANIVEQVVPPFAKTFPLPAAWETFKLSTGPTDPSCPAQGISLDQNLIATKNPSPNEILYKQSPALKPENVLFARPKNDSGSTIPAGRLKATFRIANWGSQPNPADWEVGVPIDDLWAKVPCVDADPTGAVGSMGDIGNGVTAPEASEIRCKWTLTDAELAPFVDGTRNSHSCVLVEMTDTMAPGLVYRNRSMWNNFDVRQASTLEQSAQITIKGLKAISNAGVVQGGRDIYVYVETLNMPEYVSEPNKDVGRVAEQSREYFATKDQKEGQGSLQQLIAQGKVTSTELARMIANGKITETELDTFLPTYRVRVYHDTGETLTIGGIKRPVINPQSSFGYRVTHAGDLQGWRHELRFDDPTYVVDELAPNFYRIRDVPNNGVVNVTTKIEAVEKIVPPFAWWYWFLLILIILLFLFILKWRKSKQP